ncbi:uncharacterized protein isoform X1 [Rhodnius prolixus]
MISKDTTPVKFCYNCLTYAGLLNQEGRPWSILLTAYNLIMLNAIGLGAIKIILWGDGNLQELIQAMSATIIYVHINAKAIKILYCETEIRKLFESLEQLRTELLEDIDNQHHIIDAESFLFKLNTGYALLMMSFPAVSLGINIFTDYITQSERPHLIFQVWIPWSMKEFWPYLGGMLFTTVLSISSCIFYTSYIIFLFTITFELSGFIKVLQAKLENNGIIDSNTYRHHLAVMQLIQTCNDIYSGQLYFETLVSSLQPCGFGYTLIKAARRQDPVVFDLLYKSFLAVSAPFIICSCGQEISNQMEMLHNSSYMGPWYQISPKFRKDLLIMKILNTKPITLSYRRLVTFNNACFATVAQGIYSYLAMINNLEDSE